MAATLPAFADQLFDFVLTVDPAKNRVEALQLRARTRCSELLSALDQMCEQLRTRHQPEWERFQEILETVSSNLHDFSEALEQSRGAANYRALYARLARSYEQLTKELAQTHGDVAKRLISTNYLRNLFHISGGLTAGLLYHFLLERTGALFCLGIFVVVASFLEIARRYSGGLNDVLMRLPLLRRIARPHEHYRVNSATLYSVGLLIATLTTPKLATVVAAFVLGFADPVAAAVGQRWGRRKLYKQKTIVGTAAFTATAFGVSFAYLVLLGGLPVATAGMLALAASGAGTLAELFSGRIDDNILIPVSVAACLGLLL